MKYLFSIVAFSILVLCAFQYSSSSTLVGLKNSELTGNRISILIMPPYDEVAGAGISPDIQKILEEQLARDSGLSIIKFPYKKLMNVPIYNVFDKRYCKPVLEKIKADIIIMTKLDHISEGAEMEKDEWDIKIRIYFVKTNKQVDSKIMIKKSNWSKIKSTLLTKQADLLKEIRNNL